MKDFLVRNKVFLGVVIGTMALLFGGIFLFTKNGSTSNSSKVSDNILTPPESYRFTNAQTALMLVEFGDYQCPACGAYHPLIQKLLQEFPGKLNFVFRNFPLSQHLNAPIASYAAEAAGLQGKFWQMHNKIYEAQSEWSNASDAKSIFISYAKDLGLDVEKFKGDIDSQKVKDRVSKDEADGNLIQINSTPTFYLNGIKINQPGSYDEFKKIIEDTLNKVPASSPTSSETYHIHFDLKVYLNGSPINFALSKYQESKTNPLDENIHFHDGNGKVVHVHKQGITLKELFDSLKIAIPEGTVAYVNGKKTENIVSYVPQDLDQILVGSSNLSLISNDACIYSFKCPERGTPPPESCAGGLGTGCTD